MINDIDANTIIDTMNGNDSDDSSHLPSSSISEGAGKQLPLLIPLQRLQTTYTHAQESVKAIQHDLHLRVGLVGPTNSGKSHLTNDFLAEHLLSTYYKKRDPTQATSLTQGEKDDAFRHFPARAAENKTAAVTLRPTVFIPTDGAVRLTRISNKKDALHTLLSTSNKSNKAELLTLLSSIPDTHDMFQDRDLYVDATPANNCWDAFKAASACYTREEEALKVDNKQQTTMRELTYLSWSHSKYEGPWKNLHNKLGDSAHIEWWDLPGLTDSDEVRRLLSFHCARQLHVVLLVGQARVPEPDDINRLQSLLNRPLRQVPQIINVFNVGKLQRHDWLGFVRQAGGVAQYYEAGSIDHDGKPTSMEKEVSRLLISRQNAADICPALTGNHRLAIFHALSESCRTILLYGRDKWKQLEQEGLLADLKDKSSSPRAGNAALVEQLRQCQRLKIHRAVLNPLNLLQSVLENAKRQLAQRGRLNRANINSAASAQLIRDLTAVDFAPALQWSEAVLEVPGWLDGSEEDWTGEVRLALLLFKRFHPDRTKFFRQLLSLTFGRSVVDQQLSFAALAELSRRFLRPLLRLRVHASCRSTFLALHLLLYNLSQHVDLAMLEVEERKLASQIDNQLAIFEESDAASAEDADGEDSKEQLQWMQGRGELPTDLKEQLYRDLCRTAFIDSSRIAEEQLDQLCGEPWLGEFFRSALSTEIRRRADRIFEAALEFDDNITASAATTDRTRSDGVRGGSVEAAAGQIKAEMAAVVHSVLIKLENSSPKKKNRAAWRSLISGDKWESQYRPVLTGATAQMDKATQMKHRNRIKALLKKWAIPTSETAAVTSDQQHMFLSEEPRLLERKSTVTSAAALSLNHDADDVDLLQPIPLMPSGKISGVIMGPNLQLPKREPGEHPPIFTVQPAKIDFIDTQPQYDRLQRTSSSSSSSSVLPASLNPGIGAPASPPLLGSGSARDMFERHPVLHRHPKRMLLEFKDNNSSSHEMRLVAYSGLLHDLERCLHAAQETKGKTRGIAPIFIPSKGRAAGEEGRGVNPQTKPKTRRLRSRVARARINLSEPAALDLDANPDTLIFVLVEREEAVSYVDSFSPPGQPPLPNVVFVFIPGANRGIRFVRSCILFLATCLRQALIDSKAACPHLDIFHTLDDDWRNPRVFDPALIGQQCMRPCSLFMALFYAEKVMRTELNRHDGRDALLQTADNRPPGWMALLKKAWKSAKDRDDFQLRSTLKERCADIKARADVGVLHECLARYAAALPSFQEKFLSALLQSQGEGQVVAQVGVTQMNITALTNYNCTQIGNDSQGQPAHHHHRISADRHGCVTHYLPIYTRHAVNYLNDADFFLPQQQIALRLQHLEEYADWFRSDRHFIREVLQPRGIGGMQLFKFDLDFRKVRVGGLMAIPIRKKQEHAVDHHMDPQQQEEGKGHDEDEHDEEEQKEDDAERQPTRKKRKTEWPTKSVSSAQKRSRQAEQQLRTLSGQKVRKRAKS